MTALTVSRVEQLAQDWPQYQRLRRSHPHRPAAQIVKYLRLQPAETLEQFYCYHVFEFTDGDEARGRSYCIYCGLDGDG